MKRFSVLPIVLIALAVASGRSRAMADEAIAEVKQYLASDVPVGLHLADQLHLRRTAPRPAAGSMRSDNTTDPENFPC